MKKMDLRYLIVFWAVILLAGFVFAEKTHEKFLIPSDPPEAHYVIEIELDLAEGLLVGSETITFRNISSMPLSFVAIDWKLNSLQTMEISSENRSLKLINPDMGNDIQEPLVYAIQKPVQPGTEIKLEVQFSLNTGRIGDQLSLVGSWHPRLWRERIPVRDSYEVKFNPPIGYSMAISGRLNEQTGYYNNSGVTTNFGIYLLKNAKTAVKESCGVSITALYNEEGEECALLCLDTAVDVVSFFKNWHGFYPFDFLYIVPGASRPMGGYPFASGIVVIHGQQKFEEMPLFHWKWITAHEIGHQYWGEYVMSGDTERNFDSWLMIGLGIMADKAYVLSRNLGLEKHKYFMDRYLEGVKMHYDTTMDAPPSLVKKQHFDRNNILIHGKGFSILNALESVLEKETFEKAYMKAVRSYGGKRLGYRDFQRICEEESGENLKWFFDQWVRSPKYLYYGIKSQESEKDGKEYVSSVVVESCIDSIQMPIPIRAVFEDGTSEIQTTNRLFSKNKLWFGSKARLKEVVLDPEGKLAMLNAPLPVLPEELPEKISQLPYEGAGERALELFNIAKESKMNIFQLWSKLGMVLFEGGYHDESYESFQHITQINPDKNYHFLALVWMGNVKDALGEREKAVEYYKESLQYDTGMSMRHDQFGIKTDREWVEERLKTSYPWEKRNEAFYNSFI